MSDRINHRGTNRWNHRIQQDFTVESLWPRLPSLARQTYGVASKL